MNIDDPDLPVHSISRVEDRERLLAEAMAHAEALEEQYKVVPIEPVDLSGRWKSPVATVLFVLAAALGLFPPAWLTGTPAQGPTEGELDRGLRAAIWLQAQQVEAFRLHNGRLPASLAEVPGSAADLTLIRSDSRAYQIRGRSEDGSVVVLDSSRPSPVFEAAAPWPREPTP
ncbi:MAG: hypothetical protein AMXMBFR53_20200 [Gemmatimonadota bacterium]